MIKKKQVLSASAYSIFVPSTVVSEFPNKTIERFDERWVSTTLKKISIQPFKLFLIRMWTFKWIYPALSNLCSDDNELNTLS
jgi:hypothetical protein